MMGKGGIWVIALLLVTALVAAACGGDDDDGDAQATASGAAAEDATAEAAGDGADDATEETAEARETNIVAARTVLATQGITSATDEDLVYFTEVQRAYDLFGSANAGAAQESLEGGDTRDAFFQGLLNAGVGTAFVPVLDALRALQPTAHYAEDHAAVVASVEQLVAIDAEIREAVLADDLLAFLLGNAQLARVGEEAALRQQPNLCRTLSRGGANCSSYEVNYDNAYAVALRNISAALQGAVEASGQAVGGPAEEDFLHSQLAPEEWATLIATLFGNVAVAEQDAIPALEALEPPEEFAADQARFVAAIRATNTIVGGIAADAAAGTLQSLRVDDPQFEDLLRAQCDAAAGISEELEQVALLAGDERFEKTCAGLDA